MNADAYLRKQGWKGSGHSLDLTGRGIKKPLLIAHKQDQLGLGKRKAAHTTDDQWWMRAFDQSLQTIGTGEESTLSQVRTQGINRGGLYGFFVKGEAIAGTIDGFSTSSSSVPPSGTSTPPTPAPDTDIEIKATKAMAIETSKRKRFEPDDSGVSKKTKTITTNGDNESMQEATTEAKFEDAVAAKLAKMTPEERADYESRAAAKNQTLSQYVLRRIQKKADKKADKHEIAPTPALAPVSALVESTDPPLFFADLEGDTSQPVRWVPLPNGKCPLDPTIWADRDIDSLPKKVRRAKREYIRQQRLEKRFVTKMTAEQQEKLMNMAFTKLRITPNAATEEQLTKVRDEAKKLMRQGKAIESKRQLFLNAKKEKKVNLEPKIIVDIDYTPMPDGSCPLDPQLWEGHKPKVLPKPVREARFRWLVQQRLDKKMKQVDGKQRKSLTNLTKAEKQLLRKKSAANSGAPIEEEKIDKRQWGEEELRERHLRKVERKKERKEQMRLERQEKKAAKREKKGKRNETKGKKKYQIKNPNKVPLAKVAAN